MRCAKLAFIDEKNNRIITKWHLPGAANIILNKIDNNNLAQLVYSQRIIDCHHQIKFKNMFGFLNSIMELCPKQRM